MWEFYTIVSDKQPAGAHWVPNLKSVTAELGTPTHLAQRPFLSGEMLHRGWCMTSNTLQTPDSLILNQLGGVRCSMVQPSSVKSPCTLKAEVHNPRP